jgi:uncharacterized membrane protein YgdD (TMEM256/DUF423 family)
MRILEKLLAVAAGVFGATGIILSAVAAHLEPSPALQNAALMLLVHAPALIAILVAVRTRFLPRFGGMFGAVALAIGVILFSGDLSLRIFAGMPLFPLAAPTGGILLIFGWAVLALSGIFIRRAD